MFQDWSDERFAVWLAGFFDGEGCIYIPKQGVDVSISNTNGEVIRAIFERVGVGFIEITTHGNLSWKPKHSWRVKTYVEAHAVLKLLRPYLVLKAEKADIALVKTQRFLDVRDLILERNRQIIQMSKTCTQKEVAAHFGLSRQSIWRIVNPETWQAISERRRVPVEKRRVKRSPRSESRHYRCGHVKVPVKPVTQTRQLVDSQSR